VSWDDLVPLGPVLVVLLKFVPEGYPNRTTIEQWHYPGQVPLVELSTKATPETVLQVAADGVRYGAGSGSAPPAPRSPRPARRWSSSPATTRHGPSRPGWSSDGGRPHHGG
jgi:hypothetical protein